MIFTSWIFSVKLKYFAQIKADAIGHAQSQIPRSRAGRGLDEVRLLEITVVFSTGTFSVKLKYHNFTSN